MPELPEVETIKKTLQLLIEQKTIESIDVYWPNIIKKPDDVEHFKQLLIGQTFETVKRKGKFLLFELTDYVLVSHLRMEGKYKLVKNEEKDKHTHVIFHLTNGEELHYNDVRKFGTIHVFKKGEELTNKPLIQLGPDPFDEAFTFAYFKEKLNRTSRVIKAALLDQAIVAGLGNIYVDETLFQANVHPLKRANELTDDEIRRIQLFAIDTLEKAVQQGGTTIRSYVDGAGEMGMFQQELFVYGQEGKQCSTCGTEIEKLKVSGRGTHICPTCQLFDEKELVND